MGKDYIINSPTQQPNHLIDNLIEVAYTTNGAGYLNRNTPIKAAPGHRSIGCFPPNVSFALSLVKSDSNLKASPPPDEKKDS